MRLEYKWTATLVVVLGMFMATLDNTIVNVSLPAMQAGFHTDRSTIIWVVTAYMLAQAAIIPITGYLSDRFGTKLIFITALSIFTIGSALCALSNHEGVLIASRVLQGIGGGALFPLAISIGFRVFPPEERGPASAIIGIPLLLAPAFGPTIGGYLTTAFTWNAIFAVNIPLGILGVIFAIIILHGHQAEIDAGEKAADTKRFDIPGLALSMMGITALVYGINKASDIITNSAGITHTRGWTDPEVFTFLIIGAVLIVAVILLELRSQDPVMDMRLFKNYTFSITNLLTWIMSGVLFGSMFLIPVFFEQVQGKTPLAAGEILIPQGIMAAVGMAISGALYNHTGPRFPIILGFLILAIGSIGWTQLDVTTGASTLQFWLILRGLGMGISQVPLQTLVMSSISNQAMARASSLVNATRQIFAAVGVTILTTYWVQQTSDHISTATRDFTINRQQAAQIQCIHQFGRNAQNVGACVKQQATAYVSSHAMTWGLNDTFTIVLIGCALCILIAVFVGRDPHIQQLKERNKLNQTNQPISVPALTE